MSLRALPLLGLLALPTVGRAADLDLTVTSDGLGPVSLTLRDVSPGALPSVELPGADGRTLRLDLTLTGSSVEGQPAYDLAIRVTKRTPAGRRKVHEEIFQPVLRFLPNQEASVFTGGQRPVPGTDPVAFEPVDFIGLRVLLREDAPAG